LRERARGLERLTTPGQDTARQKREAEHAQRYEQRPPGATGPLARNWRHLRGGRARVTNDRQRDPPMTTIPHARRGDGRSPRMRTADTGGSPIRPPVCSVLRFDTTRGRQRVPHARGHRRTHRPRLGLRHGRLGRVAVSPRRMRTSMPCRARRSGLLGRSRGSGRLRRSLLLRRRRLFRRVAGR
jgi:hypothetical protein